MENGRLFVLGFHGRAEAREPRGASAQPDQKQPDEARQGRVRLDRPDQPEEADIARVFHRTGGQGRVPRFGRALPPGPVRQQDPRVSPGHVPPLALAVDNRPEPEPRGHAANRSVQQHAVPRVRRAQPVPNIADPAERVPEHLQLWHVVLEWQQVGQHEPRGVSLLAWPGQHVPQGQSLAVRL